MSAETTLAVASEVGCSSFSARVFVTSRVPSGRSTACFRRKSGLMHRKVRPKARGVQPFSANGALEVAL
jgi:hypothetical protein